MSRLTLEQVENVIIDAGVVYVNYGLEDERVLAPCRGDNTFNVEAEIREVEFNGSKGKTKGLRRKISENASLEVNLAEISLENLKMALPGSRLVENKLTNGWKIKNTDYIDNITLIGKDMGDNYKKITIYNALVDGELSFVMNEDDETIITLVFSAHYDLEDEDDNLWSIEDLTSLAGE